MKRLADEIAREESKVIQLLVNNGTSGPNSRCWRMMLTVRQAGIARDEKSRYPTVSRTSALRKASLNIYGKASQKVGQRLSIQTSRPSFHDSWVPAALSQAALSQKIYNKRGQRSQHLEIDEGQQHGYATSKAGQGVSYLCGTTVNTVANRGLSRSDASY